jgi:hypothetical protein
MRRIMLAVAVILVAANAMAAAENRTVRIELGGLRQATAELSVTNSEYVVTVEMLPVATFDAALNTRLNRDKARSLALRALASHVAAQRQENTFVTVSGTKVQDAGMRGNRFGLTLSVPRDHVYLNAAARVRLPKAESPAERDAERLEPSSLLVRKAEYLESGKSLLRVLLTEIEEARNRHQKAPMFFIRVAELEEQADSCFAALVADANADKLLLSVEKAELEKLFDGQKQEVMGALTVAAKNAEDTTAEVAK